MVKFFKSLSKSLIVTVALAAFLSTAVQTQSVQAANSKPSKGKGDIVIKKPTLSEDQKATEVNALINALPKVDKLTLADTTSVNSAYSAFTALSKSQKALLTPSNSGKITAAINKIASLKGASLKALSELNSGKKAFSNFAKAGVIGAVEENKALYLAKMTKGSALTVAEIQVIVDTVNKNASATTALTVINAGTEVFADFVTAGITGAVEGDKAAYDTEIAKAKATKGSDLTLAEIQVIVDAINKNASATTALTVINAGTEVFADFVTAGITGAVEGNKVAYDTEIAKAKATKGSDLTLEEVQAVVNTENQATVDFSAAQIVIDQIIALDNTKETYATDVATAIEAYEMLTDAQKALVTNYNILVNPV